MPTPKPNPSIRPVTVDQIKAEIADSLEHGIDLRMIYEAIEMAFVLGVLTGATGCEVVIMDGGDGGDGGKDQVN